MTSLPRTPSPPDVPAPLPIAAPSPSALAPGTAATGLEPGGAVRATASAVTSPTRSSARRTTLTCASLMIE